MPKIYLFMKIIQGMESLPIVYVSVDVCHTWNIQIWIM